MKGVINVLFATHSFATSAGHHAHTVLIPNARKFNSKKNHWDSCISRRKYISLSDLAGRRGVHEKEYVFFMIDKNVTYDFCLNLLTGDAIPIKSAFHLTNKMVLNSMRCEKDIKLIIEKSSSKM